MAIRTTPAIERDKFQIPGCELGSFRRDWAHFA